MIKLDNVMSAWGTPDFAATLKREIERLGPEELPLQQGLSIGNYALAEPVTATILAVTELDDTVRVKAGIFFGSVIGGCNCADDPTPVDRMEEYCEIQMDIDKVTAVARITLAAG